MKKSILFAILFYFIQGVVHNLGHPVTPSFVRGQGIPDYMFGVFFAAMSLGMMFGAPLWGILSDRGKKKTYIVIGLLLYSIGQFGFGFTNNSVLMVLSRFISGFGVSSAVTLLTSYVIEESDLTTRAKNLAYTAASVGLGASAGYWIGGFIATNPIISTLLATSNLSMVFLYQSVANVGYILVIMWLFKEHPFIHAQTKKQTSIWQGFKEITRIDVSLLFFFGALVLMTIGGINLSKYIDVYFDELGYNPQELGTFVMASGIVSLLASVLIVPFVSRFKRQLGVLALLHICSAIIVFYVFRETAFLLVIYTVYMIYIVLRTIHQPLEQNYIAYNVKDGKYGAIMGLRQSFVSIGMVVGPLLGGFLYERSPLLLFDMSAYAFLLGVVFLICTALLKKKSMNGGNNYENNPS
jgi:MFS family permease